VGVLIGPPTALEAPKPTSSRSTTSTFGARRVAVAAGLGKCDLHDSEEVGQELEDHLRSGNILERSAERVSLCGPALGFVGVEIMLRVAEVAVPGEAPMRFRRSRPWAADSSGPSVLSSPR
jgi:hypothetical protein